MRRNLKQAAITALCGVAAILQPFLAPVAIAQHGRLVHRKDSLYHQILVYQNGPIVTLQFGRRTVVPIQSQTNLSNPREHTLEYTKLAFCGLLYKPQPKKMLVVGLGGGVIPRELHYYFPDSEIDVVELDPEIKEVATKFFSFNEDNKLKVHIDDGRVFVKKQLRSDPVPKYDIVILDAFNSDYIPFHLMTKEFLEELKGIVADDGVVVANVFYSSRLFDAEFKTFIDAFGRCQAFFGYESTNAMLVSSPSPNQVLTANEAISRAESLQSKHGFGFNLIMVARRLRPDASPERRARVLTDDRAPVNRLREEDREGTR